MLTEEERREQELIIERQIAFASGLFQGDITVRTLLESFGDGIVIIDKFGNVLLLNAHAEQMFGYAKTEIVGKKHEVLIPERFRDIHVSHMAHYFEAPKIRPMGIGLDLAGRRRDGSEFPIEISLSFIETINGTLVIAFVSDITERKLVQADLEDSRRELEAFNYTVAHDLRKPLTVINGYAQMLMEMCSDKLDEHCIGYVKKTYEGTLRMARLIDALLNFSRITHVSLRREEANLSVICAEVASELKLVGRDRHVSFRIPGEIKTDADPELMRVALGNLFDNAWKYTSNREKGVIEFGVLEVGGKRVFFVRDNGLGFDPADADKIFAPFKRLQDGQEVGGMGIGLATVKRIVHRHGGKVWAEGEPGKGATFFFSLSPD